MKNVILSADGESKVYSVPDVVADNLKEYCVEFCKWLVDSPDAKQYRRDGGIYYDEDDFIAYLNAYRFPGERSEMVKNLGWTNLGQNLPRECRQLPYFNF